MSGHDWITEYHDPEFVYVITNLSPTQVWRAGGIPPSFNGRPPDEAYGYSTFDARGTPWIFVARAPLAGILLDEWHGSHELWMYEVSTSPNMVMQNPAYRLNPGFWALGGILLSQIRRYIRADWALIACSDSRGGCHPDTIPFTQWERMSSYDHRWETYHNSGFQPWLSGYRSNHIVWRVSQAWRHVLEQPRVELSRQESALLFMRGITQGHPELRLMLSWQGQLPLIRIHEGDTPIGVVPRMNLPQFPWETIQIPDELLHKKAILGRLSETECHVMALLITATFWGGCLSRHGKRDLGTESANHCPALAEHDDCGNPAEHRKCNMLSQTVTELKSSSDSCSAVPCDSIDGLQVRFKVPPGIDPHHVKLAFESQSNRSHPAIFAVEHGSAWKSINRVPYAANNGQGIKIQDIDRIYIIDSGDTQSPRLDVKKPHDFMLRAVCTKSDYEVRLHLYNVEPEEKLGLKNLTETTNGEIKGHTVASFAVDRQDLFLKPRCIHFKKLEFFIQLSQSAWSGTYDSISLAFDSGRANTFIVNDPSPGFNKWTTINLQKTFGKDTISVHEIPGISLIDTAFKVDWWSKDAWLLQSIKLRGECASPHAVSTIETENWADKWIEHGPGWGPKGVWSWQINPFDWHNGFLHHSRVHS
ncbi:hypothetical protein CDD81_1555 [Ophiocordyceps australis]|uniref:Enterotoxin n=1 Tax=Ophiocordyceps australis TaxID=1399860 RepID=A0A2C5XZI5_9HYPO|nr:hypothetical protein CDD81_1555 [Ophiocordyceps australis]